MSFLANLFKWSPEPISTNPMKPEPAPTVPPEAPTSPIVETFDWTTAKGVYHAVRVLCDDAGLSLAEKNIICACVFQESRFSNNAIGRNKDASGHVTSTDFGLCQINDYFHIGQGKDFPSVQYVLDNPEVMVKWMIQMYKIGKLSLWSSYSTGAYKQWLNADSPMFLLSKV